VSEYAAPRIGSRTITWIAITGALILAMYGGAWMPQLDPDTAQAWSDIARLLTCGLSAAITIYAAGKLGIAEPLGRQWSLIGFGLASLTLAYGCWAFFELVAHVDIPSPGITDVFRLAFYGLAGAGIFMAGAAYRRMFGMRNEVLASLVFSTFLLVVLYTTIGMAMLADPNVEMPTKFISVLYPICDVMLLIGPTLLLLLVALKLRFARLAWPWTAVGVGALMFAGADIGYLYMTWQGLYHSGNPVDVGWLLGPVLMATGALIALDVNAGRRVAPTQGE
jgi:hypothetical protein